MSTILQEPLDRGFPPTEQASIWPTALKWGGIAGVASSAVTLVGYNLGLMDIGPDGSPPSTWLMSILQYGLYIGLLFVGLKAYRDQENGGFLTLGRGVLWSLGFGLALGIVVALFSLLFFTVLAPEYLSDLLEATLDELEESGADEETIRVQETVLSYAFSPVTLTLGSIIGSVIPTLIAGSVISFFVQSDR